MHHRLMDIDRVGNFTRPVAIAGWYLMLLTLVVGFGAVAQAQESSAVNAVRIFCYERGVYQISGSDLVNAGIDLRMIDLNQLALVHYQESVPFYVRGGEDGRFDAEDSVIFFAEGGLQSGVPFVNVYQDFHPLVQTFMLYLQASDYTPSPMQSIAIDTPREISPREFPKLTVSGHIHYEENPIWKFEAGVFNSSTKTDYLFWEELTHPETTSTDSVFESEFHLPKADYRSPAELTIRFFGVGKVLSKTGAVKHRIRVEVNRRFDKIFEWESDDLTDAVFELPPRTCRAGRNELKVTLLPPSDTKSSGDRSREIDTVLLDWFEIKFKQETSLYGNYTEFQLDKETARGGNISFQIDNIPSQDFILIDLANRTVLEGEPFRENRNSPYFAMNIVRPAKDTLLVAMTRESLLDPHAIAPVSIHNYYKQPSDAELLILTHPQFLDTLRPFIEWKRSRGLNVEAVNIMDLFNEYQGGYAGPEPLRAFIEHVYKSQPAPMLKYVLLVGDSSTISKYQTFCPAYSFMQSGQHANDNYFANFEDPREEPVVAVGRFSVRNNQQLENAVNKSMAYERRENMGPWRARLFMIAASLQWAESDAKEIMDLYGDDFVGAIMKTDKMNVNPQYPEMLNQQLIESFNEGNLITAFFGHGGGTVWEIGPVVTNQSMFRRHLFDQESVQKLENADRQPVVMALTCYTNDFDNPHVAQTLGESFVNSPGGAIAVVGATDRSLIQNNKFYIMNFMRLLLRERVDRLGTLFMRAKQDYANPRVNANYCLLGDPSLEFTAPLQAIELDVETIEDNLTNLVYQLPEMIGLPAELYLYALDEDLNILNASQTEVDSAQGALALEIENLQSREHVRFVAYIHAGDSDYVGSYHLEPKEWAQPEEGQITAQAAEEENPAP